MTRRARLARWLAPALLSTHVLSAQVSPRGNSSPISPPALARGSLKTRLGVELAESLLKEPEAEQRQRGFERLGSVGTAQALDLLLKAFESGGAARSAQDRLVAVRALAPHAAVSRVREFLVRIMVGVGSNSGRPEPIDGLIEQAAALALAAVGDDAALAALGKALRQPAHVAETASDALLAFPPRHLEPILQGLRSPTRSLVALLGALGDTRAIPALREFVRGAPNDVRPEAAVALARLGERETLELARHWLKHEASADFRIAAARILQELHAPDAGAAAAALLSDEASRAAALELATRASLPELAAPLLRSAAQAPKSEQNARFAALGLTGTRAAFVFLGGALSTPQTSSAAALALALAPAAEAEEQLEQALSQRNTRRAALRASLVRWAALERTPSGFSAALRELSSSRETSDRALSFQANALLSPERVPELARRATGPELRALARAALLPQVARALADRLAVEADPELREALAACLVSFEAAAQVPSNVLLDLLEARGLAAPLAARALSARDSRTLRPRILALLESNDALLRGHAALGLGQSQDGSALGILERAYRFETDGGVRLAIVQALSARHEPARKRVLRLARQLDGSAAVRQAAALGLTGTHPAAERAGAQTAWLELTLSEGDARAARTVGALLVTADGLAVPAFADPDGVLLLPGLPAGPFELRLAAPTRSDNAGARRMP